MGADGVALIGVIAGLVVDLGIKIAALIVIPRDRKPSSAMAWLLAIFLIPYAGIAFFLLLGNSKLPRSRRSKQERIDEVISAARHDVFPEPDLRELPDWLKPIVEMNTRLGAIPLVGGNTATLLDDYRGSIDAMTADIETAASFVHIEFYILALDETTSRFFAAVERAVARGVTVRVLIDHIASIRTSGHRHTFAELDRIGVQWAFMLPVQPLKGRYQRPDLRNHRKLVVVDGVIGYTGSQNLIDRSYDSKKNIARGLQWQELVTRVTGPVVTELDVIFLGDWFSETGERLPLQRDDTIEDEASWTSLDCQVVPSGPGYSGENNLRLFLALVHSARERVIITSPYFVPDEAMVYAITSACERGLDVQLFVSEIGDQGPVFHAQRSYYGELLRAGVRIWMYPAPYILHAKHLSIDDNVAVIGSSNMDIRSFSLDLEISLLVHGRSFVADMRAVEDGYRRVGTELTAEMWDRQPALPKVLDGLARLTSGLQ